MAALEKLTKSMTKMKNDEEYGCCFITNASRYTASPYGHSV